MNFFTKRNLIIALVVILVMGGAVIWYLARAPEGGEKEGEEGFFARLFPGGGRRELTEEEQRRLEEGPAPTEAEKPITQKLVAEPVSGATFVKNKIRYIERETGHVYEIDLNGQNKTRISNTTIPGIFEVSWSPDGGRAILKYISAGRLNLLSARFTASSTQGVLLSSEVKDALFSPRGDRIAYLLPSGQEGLLITATPENRNQRTVLRTPLVSWRISWPEEANFYIFPAPSAFGDGFLYRVSLGSGALSKLLGPRLGLELTTDGRNLLFTESDRDNKTIFSAVLNLTTRKITPLNLKIIPEKCVWSKQEKNLVWCATATPFPPAVLPDDWYKGLVSFADILVKINTASLSAQSFELEKGPDALGLFISEDEKNLFYLNRRDGSLWRVEI